MRPRVASTVTPRTAGNRPRSPRCARGATPMNRGARSARVTPIAFVVMPLRPMRRRHRRRSAQLATPVKRARPSAPVMPSARAVTRPLRTPRSRSSHARPVMQPRSRRRHQGIRRAPPVISLTIRNTPSRAARRATPTSITATISRARPVTARTGQVGWRRHRHARPVTPRRRCPDCIASPNTHRAPRVTWHTRPRRRAIVPRALVATKIARTTNRLRRPASVAIRLGDDHRLARVAFSIISAW